MFDIHSHILFGVDDGAQTPEESVELLKKMQNENIDYVMATPHFYPQDTNLDDFLKVTRKNFTMLKKFAEKNHLPKIYLGCELLYFNGLGQSTSLNNLCLNNSEYLLLELTDGCINERLFSDISWLTSHSRITPIIAHIERYYRAKNFKKLIEFVVKEKIPVQINAASFLFRLFKRPIKKLIKSGALIVLGTDTHSIDMRPPRMTEALEYIEKKFGKDFKETLLKNSEFFKSKIIG